MTSNSNIPTRTLARSLSSPETVSRASAAGPKRRALFGFVMVMMLAGQYLPALLIAAGEGMPPLMPLLCLPLVWAAWWRHDTTRADQLDLWTALLLALVYCLPVQTLGWLLLATSAGYLWLRNPRGVRVALGIAVVASIAVPVTEHALKWFAMPLLSADAWVAARILLITTGVGSSEGNLIMGPGSHALVVLHGCSSLHNLGGACLAWWALHTFAGTGKQSAVVYVLPLVAAAVVALNLARLCLMAVDPTWHEWWHAGPGVSVYQMLSTGMPLLAAAFSTARTS